MNLEKLIHELLVQTALTPDGGVCVVGGKSITIWYCSDIWEWEFQGHTYWDVQDLAEAILRACTEAA